MRTNDMFSAADYSFMALALQLAERGLNTTTPNPRVGCVIVRDSKVIGSGWHQEAGQPHAEIHALDSAGTATHGATVYVTLEPCSHFGRTPPCANALIKAGIAKVIIATDDPNPIVSGRGRAILEQAKINVQTGLLEQQARELNIGFFNRMTKKKPWVRLKIAASLDGKTALNNGASQWITGESARTDGHRWRARSCAILTGIGTIQTDNPQLTVRHIKTTRQPQKIVIDRRLRISLDAKLLHSDVETWIFTAYDGDSNKREQLDRMGVKVITLPDRAGAVDLDKMMVLLAEWGINELLVEAGSGLNGALIAAGLVDEMILYLAPHLLGNQAVGMFDLSELTNLIQKQTLKLRDVRMIGHDVRIIARL